MSLIAVSSATGARVERFTSGSSAGIPQNTSPGFTLMGVFEAFSSRAANECLMLLRGEATTGQYVGVYAVAGANMIRIVHSSGNSADLTFPLNTKTLVILSGNGGTYALTRLQLGTVTTSASVNTATGPTTPQFDMVRIGADGFGSNFPGEYQSLMAFNKALSTAEINAQARYVEPLSQLRQNLLFWLPMQNDPLESNSANECVDISGNGFNFTPLPIVTELALARPTGSNERSYEVNR